jgi:hypothetical protein
MTTNEQLAIEAGLLVEQDGLTYWTEGDSARALDAFRAKVKQEHAQQIFNWLMTSTFERWHEGEFAAYVHGDEDRPEKEDLLKEIEYFLG